MDYPMVTNVTSTGRDLPHPIVFMAVLNIDFEFDYDWVWRGCTLRQWNHLTELLMVSVKKLTVIFLSILFCNRLEACGYVTVIGW